MHENPSTRRETALDLEGKTPEIEYPCQWNYTVIGSDQERLRLAVVTAVGEAEHDLDFSHRSSKGSYVSLKLRVQVLDDEHRRGLFECLSQHQDVRFVL
ncbi:MAG: DUF493 domain-containing protein [Planctomycetota bacterium]